MSSVGVMASAVVTGGPCTSVLREPFDHLANWATVSGPPIIAGRTGTAARMTGSADTATYTMAGGVQSDYITLGFAYRIDTMAAAPPILELLGDAAVTRHGRLVVSATGVLTFQRNNDVNLASSAAGAVVINTWQYIEVQARLHDTLGSVIVRVDGTPVITATGLDTKNLGTAAVYDSIRLMATTGANGDFDDLYLTTGAGCAFQGDQTIVNAGPVVLVEPFDNLTAWTLGSGGTINAGGQVGNFYRTASGASRGYPVPAPAQSTDFDLTFWWRCSNVGTLLVTAISVQSASGIELAVTVTAPGKAWQVQTLGNILGTGAANAVVVNTWYRIYFAAHMAASPNGWARLDIDGASVVLVSGALTYGATPNTATVQTANINGLTEDYDEMILKTGT